MQTNTTNLEIRLINAELVLRLKDGRHIASEYKYATCELFDYSRLDTLSLMKNEEVNQKDFYLNLLRMEH